MTTTAADAATAVLPRVGLALSTLGTRPFAELLASAAASTHPPTCVAVANQSGRPLTVDVDGHSFDVFVVDSGGGVSRGRNQAAAALAGRVDVVGFPNDDSAYPPSTLAGVAAAFAARSKPRVQAVACSYVDPQGPRFVLPQPGTVLDRRSVWRAIEPATFFDAAAFADHGGFREDLGSGSAGPWGSGEGTDLLLRLMASGGTVVGRADLVVRGGGEKRDLSPDAVVRKHRSYARGTGLVYREHGYRRRDRARILAGPLVRPLSHDPSPALSIRLAAARVLGRVEGLRGRPFLG